MYDIRFFSDKDGPVPFVVTGKCQDKLAAAQRVLLLLFDPDVGGLDPGTLMAYAAPAGALAVAFDRVRGVLREQEPDMEVSVLLGDRTRSSLALTVTVDGGIPVVVALEG